MATQAPPEPTADEPAPTAAPEDDGAPVSWDASNWEFQNEIPTPERVKALLETLPDQWGVTVADFIDYVVPLPSNKKVKVNRPTETGGTVRVEQQVEVWTLYMSVAGREMMLAEAARINDWRVDLHPEPVTAGVGGFIELGGEGERIIYREACTIFVRHDDGEQEMLGTRTGTAWIPGTNRQQAAKSNPFEKVETSARGRAIAAWGIGILPGSGVASLDEMLSMLSQPRDQQQAQRQPQQSYDELLERARLLAEEVRQLRDIDHDEMDARVIEFGQRSFQHDVTDANGALDWSKFRPAHLPLLISTLETQRRKLVGDQIDAP